VRVTLRDGVPIDAQLTAAMLPEERATPATREELADILSLSPADLVGGSHMPMAVSCGIPWLIIPLTSPDAVRRARIRMEPWERILKGTWGAWPFVFALTDGVVDATAPVHAQGVDIVSRAFLPGAAVPEDPATGSANACLAGYLAARTPRDGLLRWEVAQGVEMGRASRLRIEASQHEGAITAIRVGGATVLVNEGTMRIP
jgi:trans-2,3-dihydro-3-hydroxyanthranilate isomerase